MKKFSFKEIKFYSGNYDQIKKEFDKGGVLVAPAASALANIDSDKQYYTSLKNSKIAILDSGFFCILLRIFKFKKVKKLSGFLFLKTFLDNFNNQQKILFIDPSKKSNILNLKFLRSKKIINFKTYIAPNYNKRFIDIKLIKLINNYKPKYIIINIGGGSQEPLAIYIDKNIKYKASIMCTGAAIAFMTGEQAPINKVIDKVYLGWLTRIIWDPKLYLGRILKSFKIIKFFF
jgi:N-acetylglucosaminyldiphosphoundecaprenol N-acetyl-beta-D-mannosaminyltransferase